VNFEQYARQLFGAQDCVTFSSHFVNKDGVASSLSKQELADMVAWSRKTGNNISSNVCPVLRGQRGIICISLQGVNLSPASQKKL
jgi:hypothetical protein